MPPWNESKALSAPVLGRTVLPRRPDLRSRCCPILNTATLYEQYPPTFWNENAEIAPISEKYCLKPSFPLRFPPMDRPNENLLSRLEQSLRQSRAARLRELEVEADAVRAELAEMDTLASQSEAAIYRLLSSVLSSSSLAGGLPSDLELENAMRQSAGHSRPPLGLESRDVRRQEIPAIR